MVADYTNEFINSIDAAYTLYPEIKGRIDGISVIFELEHGLGKLAVEERDYIFMFNPKLMSLGTVHHEVAHMVCVALGKPVDHGTDFQSIENMIMEYCSNIELHKQEHMEGYFV